MASQNHFDAIALLRADHRKVEDLFAEFEAAKSATKKHALVEKICAELQRGRPSVGETPANTVDVFLASTAPLARDSGCPPNRVNPNQRPAALPANNHAGRLRGISPCGLTGRARSAVFPGLVGGLLRRNLGGGTK